MFSFTDGVRDGPSHGTRRIANWESPSAFITPSRHIGSQDLNDDNDFADVGEGAVDAHATHPKVKSITLKPIPAAGTGDNATPARTLGNVVVVTADTDGDPSTPTTGLGNNQFILIVEFDQKIGTSNQFEAAEFTRKLWNATKTSEAAQGDFEVSSVTAMTGSETKFEVKVTIDQNSNDGSVNPLIKRLMIFFQLAQQAIFWKNYSSKLQ